MSKKKLNIHAIVETLIIFRRSLIYQTKEFFQNSTLHGVRYIAETGRPIGEKFMWFCFTSIGAVTALVIIMSLWEKFQTNPTITGLDTDFHNQNVVFPTTVVCPAKAFDPDKVYDVAYNQLSKNDVVKASLTTPFLEILTTMSFGNINEAADLAKSVPSLSNEKNLRKLVFQAAIDCESLLIECKYRDETVNCCEYFQPVYTEHGFCYAFNSRFMSKMEEDEKVTTIYDLYETDKKWALFFLPNITSKIFIFSNEEYFGSDFSDQLEWFEGQSVEVRISKKNTYTTNDARQLSIGQRKCIFFNEVTLQYFPGEDYTFSSCMKECRMKKAIKFCKCNPPFYKPVANVNNCTVADFECLNTFKVNITDIRNCMQCELSCSKTVFNIEKLTKLDSPKHGVHVEFLTWPIIRYKREVLFGWVDLLVSFGGIASLFLGFSLLSGVEIIYYFTMRACCMVYKNRQELYEIEERMRSQPPPPIELSLKPKIQMGKGKSELNMTNPNALNNLNEKSINIDKLGVGNDFSRRRRGEKDFIAYSKSLYKEANVLPQYADLNQWQYGRYLP